MMAVPFPSRNNMSLADRQALRRAELAQELMRSATAIEPIQTHTQGLAKLAQALVGGMIEQKAQKEAAAKEAEKRRQAMALLKGLGAAVPDEPAPQPQPEPPGFFGRLFGWGQDQPAAVQPAAGMSPGGVPPSTMPPVPQAGQMPAALPAAVQPQVPQAGQMPAGAAAQPSPVSGSSVLRDPAFLAYLSSLESPDDIMSVVLPLTLNEREREDRRQEKEEDRAFQRQEREEERAYREAMRQADQEYRAQQLALDRQRLALSARETFGAPQAVMRDGQPVYIQVGSQGTIRELPGYTPEQQGLFSGNSLEGQRINYLLNNQDKVNTPEYNAVFVEQYGPKQITDAQGNVTTVIPVVPPGFAIPDAMKPLYEGAAGSTQGEPMQPEPMQGMPAPNVPATGLGEPLQGVPATNAPADQYEALPPPVTNARPPDAPVTTTQSLRGGRVIRETNPERPLSAQEQSALLELDENIGRTQKALPEIDRALELNQLAFEGPYATEIATAAGLSRINPEAAAATQEFHGIVTQLAADVAKTLGPNPSNVDLQLLREIHGMADMSQAQRASTLKAARRRIERGLASDIQRREMIKRGEYGRTNPNYTTPPQSRASEPPASQPQLPPASQPQLPPASQPQLPPQSRASEPPPDFIVVDPRNPRLLRQYMPHAPMPDPRTTVGGMIVP